MNKYYLDMDILILCQHFAERVASTNIDCYKNRNQHSIEKIKKDILIGKLAEWGVYFIYHVQHNKLNVTPPDMNIYSASDKSFDPDLKFGLFNLHVKSQTTQSALKYGDSWIFQGKDPLFEYASEYDIILGCRVNVREDGAVVELKLEKPFKSLIFGDTKLSKFGGNKKAVYLEDNK